MWKVNDIYFPVFVVFKLILLIGWLKVANCIEKPFGTDDTDFQAGANISKNSDIELICSLNMVDFGQAKRKQYN